MMRTKICGITTMDDALMAVELGADALGFIFAPSLRQVTPECARRMVNRLPPFVQSVGVFVNETPATIKDIMGFCGLDRVQLHGKESPKMCQELMPHTIKAFRLKDAFSLMPIRPYQGKVRALLLDTYQSGRNGGTGKTFDWNLALKAKELGMPVILSGGLGPSNIEKAVSIVNPYAVDVNSCIEISPGKKSRVLVSAVMESVNRIQAGGVVHG
ncbi:MAG: phosphoribosylanthranilate isomerase [Desulfatiglandaceae bacterium]